MSIGEEFKTLTVQDVAEIVDRAPNSVRKWIRNGSINAVRVGREYRMSKADLNTWWRSRGGGVLFPSAGDGEAAE
jgi:excisionase family DNA binding protein